MADRVWNFACPDWEKKLAANQSLMPVLPLFKEEGDIAVSFFDAMRLPDVPGTPTLKASCGEWFRDIVRTIMGARDPATNIRHVPELFLMVGKGSSKTTYSAALMLTAMLMNVRPRANFFLIAPSQATADVAFSAAAGMVKIDPELDNRFWVRENEACIQDRINGSRLEVKTFSLQILNGPKPAGVLLDELHLLAKEPHAASIMRQIRGGLQKTTEGFLIITTTQSNEPPQGIFEDELRTARAIRSGAKKGRMLPILYEFPERVQLDETEWSNPKNWRMVLPNLGKSVHLDQLISDWETEKDKGEEQKKLWASQHLSIQIGVGIRAHSWAGSLFWAQSTDKTLTLETLLERSEVVTIGIDGGGLDDLLGLAVLGRDKVTKHWLLWCHAWAHPIVLQRRKEIADRLKSLSPHDLTIVAKPGDDVIGVADILSMIKARGLLPETLAIGVDAVGILEIYHELTAEHRGFSEKQIHNIIQGYRLNGPIKTTERALAGGTMFHADQKLMDWCVDNAKAEPKGNAVLVSKQISGSAKIDPVIATFNAVALMALNPSVKTAPKYEIYFV